MTKSRVSNKTQSSSNLTWERPGTWCLHKHSCPTHLLAWKKRISAYTSLNTTTKLQHTSCPVGQEALRSVSHLALYFMRQSGTSCTCFCCKSSAATWNWQTHAVTTASTVHEKLDFETDRKHLLHFNNISEICCLEHWKSLFVLRICGQMLQRHRPRSELHLLVCQLHRQLCDIYHSGWFQKLCQHLPGISANFQFGTYQQTKSKFCKPANLTCVIQQVSSESLWPVLCVFLIYFWSWMCSWRIRLIWSSLTTQRSHKM